MTQKHLSMPKIYWRSCTLTLYPSKEPNTWTSPSCMQLHDFKVLTISIRRLFYTEITGKCFKNIHIRQKLAGGSAPYSPEGPFPSGPMSIALLTSCLMAPTLLSVLFHAFQIFFVVFRGCDYLHCRCISRSYCWTLPQYLPYFLNIFRDYIPLYPDLNKY